MRGIVIGFLLIFGGIGFVALCVSAGVTDNEPRASDLPYPTPHPGSLSAFKDYTPFIHDVIERIRKDCPLLDEMLPSISDVTFEWRLEDPRGSYTSRAYGWGLQLELAFIISNTEHGLDGLGIPGIVRGDYMFFLVGAGSNPGVEIDKPTSRYACGQPVDKNFDILIRDPWMSSLATKAPTDLFLRQPRISESELKSLRRLTRDPPIRYAE